MRVRLASVAAATFCGLTLLAPASAGARTIHLDMLHAVNAVRAQHGLAPFRSAPALHRSARKYASWMLRADYFGHLSRIRASSRFSLLGENLAWSAGRRWRVGRTVRSWMQSPPHKALILHPGFQWLGAGASRGRLGSRTVTAWVLHFGGGRSSTGSSVAEPGGTQFLSDSSTRSAPPAIDTTTSAAGASSASAAP